MPKTFTVLVEWSMCHEFEAETRDEALAMAEQWAYDLSGNEAMDVLQGCDVSVHDVSI